MMKMTKNVRYTDAAIYNSWTILGEVYISTDSSLYLFSATAYFCDKDNVEQNIAHVAKHFSHEFRPSKCKALDISYCIECHAGALVFCFKLHLEYIYFGRKFFK